MHFNFSISPFLWLGGITLPQIFNNLCATLYLIIHKLHSHHMTAPVMLSLPSCSFSAALMLAPTPRPVI